MTDLDDIGFELKDDNESSSDVLEICPLPPSPFNKVKVENDMIIQPPMTFNDQEQAIVIKNIVPFDNIFFNDAKNYLFEATKNNSSTPNDAKKKSDNKLFHRFINFFRSAIIRNHTLEFNRQCEQLLNLTTYSCNMSDRIHIRILYTIYRRLTNSKEVFYTAVGSHWEDIGFQTSNPETDFRSTGLFSIFFLLYFVDSMYLPLAKQIYQLSRDKQQQFPFCCIGINLANILIKYLRRTVAKKNIGKLIDENKVDQSATDLCGQLFIALFLNFYIKWRDNLYSIEHTQQVLLELERTIINRPKVLLQEFDNYFTKKHTEKSNQLPSNYEFKTTNENLI